jgi:hypothetical protein
MSTNKKYINSTKKFIYSSLDFCSANVGHKYACGCEVFLQAIRASTVSILTEV